MKVEQKSSTGGNQKTSMFGAKVGFVIPKNKLSGSLVPVYRGCKTAGSADPLHEKNKVHARKTKWGPDLTQDPFVRKGQLLAYQTRVDQIEQLIKKTNLGNEANPDMEMGSSDGDSKSSHHEIDSEELEKLQLERREIIGEILKLNPSYKAPPDYVPLLKEARVLISVKEYPKCNFLGLLFGSGSDTLKRLEKETGAKIQVFGNQGDSTKVVEITSDRKGNQDNYSELYAIISADTYDKVDAAVALVELLVTPASGPLGANVSVLSQSSDSTNRVSNMVAVVEPPVRPTEISQAQFQYNIPVNPAQRPGSIPNPQGSTSLVGLSALPTVSTGPLISDLSQQPFMQSCLQPYMPQVYVSGQTGPPSYPSGAAQHPFTSQSNLSTFQQFNGGQPNPLGTASLARPLGTSLPNLPTEGQLYQLSSSTGWPGPPIPSPSSSSSMIRAAAIAAQGHQTIGGHPPPVGTYPASYQGPFSAPLLTPSMPNFAMQSAMPRGQIALPSPNLVNRPGLSASLPSPTVSSFPRATHPIGTASRMQFPSSGDLTPRHQQPQNPAAPVKPWPGSSSQNNLPVQRPLLIPFPSGAPPFPHDIPSQAHRPPMHGYLRPPVDEHFGQFRPHFPGQNHPDVFRRPSFPPLSQMDEVSLNRSRLMVSMHGSQPPRSENAMQFQQDYPSSIRPGRNPFNSNPSFLPGRQAFRPVAGQQVYDPFSPTADANSHQQKSSNLAKPNQLEEDDQNTKT